MKSMKPSDPRIRAAPEWGQALYEKERETQDMVRRLGDIGEKGMAHLNERLDETHDQLEVLSKRADSVDEEMEKLKKTVSELRQQIADSTSKMSVEQL